MFQTIRKTHLSSSLSKFIDFSLPFLSLFWSLGYRFRVTRPFVHLDITLFVHFNHVSYQCAHFFFRYDVDYVVVHITVMDDTFHSMRRVARETPSIFFVYVNRATREHFISYMRLFITCSSSFLLHSLARHRNRWASLSSFLILMRRNMSDISPLHAMAYIWNLMLIPGRDCNKSGAVSNWSFQLKHELFAAMSNTNRILPGLFLFTTSKYGRYHTFATVFLSFAFVA